MTLPTDPTKATHASDRLEPTEYEQRNAPYPAGPGPVTPPREPSPQGQITEGRGHEEGEPPSFGQSPEPNAASDPALAEAQGKAHGGEGYGHSYGSGPAEPKPEVSTTGGPSAGPGGSDSKVASALSTRKDIPDRA